MKFILTIVLLFTIPSNLYAHEPKSSKTLYLVLYQSCMEPLKFEDTYVNKRYIEYINYYHNICTAFAKKASLEYESTNISNPLEED